MTRYQRALAVSCLLAALPFASTVWAQNPHQSVASDGSRAVITESAATVSASNEGSGGGVQPFKEMTVAERAKMLSLPGIYRGSPESIIGADSRVRINPTTTFPYRAVVLITFSAGRCTGWFIDANTIATAGHCVSPGNNTGFYATSSYTIYPGYNGTGAGPYGSCTANRLNSVVGWTQSGDDRYDYGAIKLNCTKGNQVGWFGYFWTTGSLLNFTTTTSGYPGDKPFTQWRSIDYVRATDERRVFYQNDTVGGQSGSPVWVSWRLCNPCALAVHAYGSNGTNNHGTRIVQPVFNNFNAWKNS